MKGASVRTEHMRENTRRGQPLPTLYVSDEESVVSIRVRGLDRKIHVVELNVPNEEILNMDFIRPFIKSLEEEWVR